MRPVRDSAVKEGAAGVSPKQSAIWAQSEQAEVVKSHLTPASGTCALLQIQHSEDENAFSSIHLQSRWYPQVDPSGRDAGLGRYCLDSLVIWKCQVETVFWICIHAMNIESIISIKIEKKYISINKISEIFSDVLHWNTAAFWITKMNVAKSRWQLFLSLFLQVPHNVLFQVVLLWFYHPPSLCSVAECSRCLHPQVSVYWAYVTRVSVCLFVSSPGSFSVHKAGVREQQFICSKL